MNKVNVRAYCIRPIFTAIIALATAFTLNACSSGDDGGDGDSSSSGEVGLPSSGSSSGDGIYNTVPIGGQVWMAKNLDIDVPGSECYAKKPENCEKYGRLYNWEAANTACPSGWHLPTQAEWKALSDFIESDKWCSDCTAKYLKAKDGWKDYEGKSGNGTDAFGFAALPGGNGLDGGFYDAGGSGNWWSASENNANYAYKRNMNYNNEGAYWSISIKTYLFSIRCLAD